MVIVPICCGLRPRRCENNAVQPSDLFLAGAVASIWGLIGRPTVAEVDELQPSREGHQHSNAAEHSSTNAATEKACKGRQAQSGKNELEGSEHGLKRHADKLDDGAAREQQSPNCHHQSPSEFVGDQRRNSEEDRNEDGHDAAIAWSKTMRVNRR